MNVRFDGGTARISGVDLWQKELKKIIGSATSEALDAGIFNTARDEDGNYVAEYAFYNEFGATIKTKERTQTLRFRKNKKGQFVFAKKSRKKVAKEKTVKISPGVINIPPRPFMRNTVNANQAKWFRLLRNYLKRNDLRDPLIWKKAFVYLGEIIESDIKATIESSVPPPNAPSTVRAKKARGNANPNATLQFRGNLLKSISYQLRNAR